MSKNIITPNFTEGDKVYFLSNKGVGYGKVRGTEIHIGQTAGESKPLESPSIKHIITVEDGYEFVEDGQCFGSKEEIIQMVKDFKTPSDSK